MNEHRKQQEEGLLGYCLHEDYEIGIELKNDIQ